MTRLIESDSRLRTALLVAFHFPPYATSSGVHRTVSLARHLSEYGWRPVILTAHPRAYGASGFGGGEALPGDIAVSRAQAFDVAKFLTIRGRYPQLLALPDRWLSWFAGAIPSGLRLILKHRPSVIWSTYPIATAHLIGWTLHRLTNLPWIADFRDPMVEQIDGVWYPADAATRRCRMFVERRAAGAANVASFCTETARRIFVERYAGKGRAVNSVVIANGFDPFEFSEAEKLPSRRDADRLHLVHSGTLYPGPDRDPSALFIAIARLREQGRLPGRLRITLRASGFDANYMPTIERLGLTSLIQLAPPLGYRDALREIMDADGLLLFQGRTSNPAIPAKVYEYLRARKPLLAMIDDDGETAGLLRTLNVGMRVSIDDANHIQSAMTEFISGIQQNTHRVLAERELDLLSRVARVKEFAELMNAAAHRATSEIKKS